MKKILVTGGRDYADSAHVAFMLSEALKDFGPICVIQGGAAGADRLAKEWALANGVPCITMDAAWKALGKGAGMTRNRWMVDICVPDFVIAFSGGVGTHGMIAYARSQNIKVYEV